MRSVLGIRPAWIITGACAMVLALGAIGSALAPHHPAAPRPAATRTAAPAWTVTMVKPAPYAVFADTLAVNFTVTNASGPARVPVCTVTAASGHHTGRDVLDEMDQVGAGRTVPVTAEVTVARAAHARVTSVRCR